MTGRFDFPSQESELTQRLNALPGAKRFWIRAEATSLEDLERLITEVEKELETR